MATAADLVKRARRRLRDWPQHDQLTASIAAGGTTLTVSDTTVPRYYVNERVEVDYELMLVQAVASATTLTVLRGAEGSTDVSHPSGSTVLVNPGFASQEILDELNVGLDNLWPFFYQEVVDESLTTTAEVYEYTVPSVSGLSVPLPRLRSVEIRESGLVAFRACNRVDVMRGATPKLRLGFSPPDGATLRLRGYAPFPHLAFTDSTHAQLPYQADSLAVEYAVGMLLMSGEAGRVRFDRGPIDTREQATRVGSSMNASRAWLQSFYQQRSDLAMPPMQPHVVITV